MNAKINLTELLSINTKKLTKINAFKAIVQAIEDKDIELTHELKSALKTIYPATKAKNVTDYWKLLCKFSGKKDIRYYLNGIYVKDKNTLIASNGHTLCVVEFDDFNNSHGLTVGALYEAQNEKVVAIEAGDFKYPDFSKLFKNNYKKIALDFEGIHNGYDKSVDNQNYNKVENSYFLNTYLKFIPKNITTAEYCTDDSRSIVGSGCLKTTIETSAYTATIIIMPTHV